MASGKFVRYTPLEAIKAAADVAEMLADQLDFSTRVETTEDGAAEAAEAAFHMVSDLADLLDVARRWDR